MERAHTAITCWRTIQQYDQRTKRHSTGSGFSDLKLKCDRNIAHIIDVISVITHSAWWQYFLELNAILSDLNSNDKQMTNAGRRSRGKQQKKKIKWLRISSHRCGHLTRLNDNRNGARRSSGGSLKRTQPIHCHRLRGGSQNTGLLVSLATIIHKFQD